MQSIGAEEFWEHETCEAVCRISNGMDITLSLGTPIELVVVLTYHKSLSYE